MKIVVLTGAGISAESGLATFRDSEGLWEGHRPEDVATPEAFASDPEMVQRFYDERRASLRRVQPNAAHEALGRLAHIPGVDLFLVTQNVDDLHERGGSPQVHHMHGQLRSALCTTCGDRFEWHTTLVDQPDCPGCTTKSLRPDIVWFGEIPYGMSVIEQRLLDCDVFVSIGTSGNVYPAAAFVHYASAVGARTLELNMEQTGGDFAQHRSGPATELVPAWVREVETQVSVDLKSP